MPTIRFSVCPTCDCGSFDFYETTGRAPGRSDGYGETEVISGYVGTLTWKTPGGTTVATYSVTPSDDASAYQQIKYISGVNVSNIADGAYNITYTVEDGAGSIIGTTTQPVVVSCQLDCDLEEKIDQYISAIGKGKQILLESINEISKRIRMASWLAQSGYPDRANKEILIAQDYV